MQTLSRLVTGRAALRVIALFKFTYLPTTCLPACFLAARSQARAGVGRTEYSASGIFYRARARFNCPRTSSATRNAIVITNIMTGPECGRLNLLLRGSPFLHLSRQPRRDRPRQPALIRACKRHASAILSKGPLSQRPFPPPPLRTNSFLIPASARRSPFTPYGVVSPRVAREREHCRR